LTRRAVAWLTDGRISQTLDQEKPVMSKYIEIQLQSPATGAAYLAQWYVDGSPSGRAFPIYTVGELRFVAFFAEAPLLVADEATRAMLCERGYTVLSVAS
jgi:hypothetical protein